MEVVLPVEGRTRVSVPVGCLQGQSGEPGWWAGTGQRSVSLSPSLPSWSRQQGQASLWCAAALLFGAAAGGASRFAVRRAAVQQQTQGPAATTLLRQITTPRRNMVPPLP